MKFPKKLYDKIEARKQSNAFRQLPVFNNLIDFSSNDYLGFAKSESIFHETHNHLLENELLHNGATGSRLLSGNHDLYQEVESFIARFHQSESALIFNSGYDANVGFFNSVPQRNDIILYDELSHASIRDGIKMSNAKSCKFSHNDLESLEKLILQYQNNHSDGAIQDDIYIVTESVFSMDGDSPNLEQLATLSEKYQCQLIIDEAHALGVFGNNGDGLIQQLHLQERVFARITTFGKGLGCHGAAILCNEELKEYLINFARSFIYTTALPPHSVAAILTAYKHLEKSSLEKEKLTDNILFFNQEKNRFGLKPLFVRSKSAIQSAIIPGNDTVKNLAAQLQKNGFDVKAILSPTVPIGQERIRICLHSYNLRSEITELSQLLNNFATA